MQVENTSYVLRSTLAFNTGAEGLTWRLALEN